MLSEQRITFEIAAWIGRKWVISDAVALELFSQFRGSSDYPFDGVGPSGIVDDAEGVLNDLTDTIKALPAPGNRARHEELDALKGWVRNWQFNHTDVDGTTSELIARLHQKDGD